MKIKKLTLLLLLAGALCAKPVPVVFDTDMGNDVDDAVALASLHALESMGECKIVAVTTTKDNPFSPVLCDVINTFYGRPDIPIGEVKGSSVTPQNGAFAGVICTRKDADGRYTYARRAVADGSLPDAVKVLRRALAEAEDNSLVFIVVGFSTNMARLLISPPDEISPLGGKELLAKKGKLVSMMAGEFAGAGRAEYNVREDVPSARDFYRDCPIEMVFSGEEYGKQVLYPWANTMNDFKWAKCHPVQESLWRFRGTRPHDRPTWDPCAALYAVRPDAKYFTLSEQGTVAVADSKGRTSFTPSKDGKHRYMLLPTESQRKALLDTFIELTARPVDGASAR